MIAEIRGLFRNAGKSSQESSLSRDVPWPQKPLEIEYSNRFDGLDVE